MNLTVVYLSVWACLTPSFVECRQLAGHQLPSLYRCEMTRPIAAHLYQQEVNNAEEWIFTHCAQEDGPEDEHE